MAPVLLDEWTAGSQKQVIKITLGMAVDLRENLKIVIEALAQGVRNVVMLLPEIGQHVVSKGGKRLFQTRPTHSRMMRTQSLGDHRQERSLMARMLRQQAEFLQQVSRDLPSSEAPSELCNALNHPVIGGKASVLESAV